MDSWTLRQRVKISRRALLSSCLTGFRSLCSQRRQIVTVEIPKIYKEAYREILKADPCVVDLHKLEIYFYEFGSYLARLDHRDSQPIGAMLVQTFKDRFRQVMDWAQNSGADPLIAQRLDALERQLFSEGRQSRARLNRWLNTGSSQLLAADMVVSHKKRKLVELEGL